MPATKDNTENDDGVVEQKRKELTEETEKWRAKGAALTEQMESRKESYDQMRENVKNVFDDLDALLERRRQEFINDIQKERDAHADLIKTRDSMASHLSTLEHVLSSSSDEVLLRMMKELEPRSKQLMELQVGRAEDVEAASGLCLDDEKISDLKSAISALGEKGSILPQATPGISSSSTGPAESDASDMAAGASATSPTTTTTTTTTTPTTTTTTTARKPKRKRKGRRN